MEWSFSVKPRALSIVTWAPVPSHGSGRTIGVFGGGILGGGLSIRREWRGSKKLGLRSQSHYSKFLFKASLESQGLLEVASAAAVSAVTVMYFNYSRKQFDIKEISGRVTRALYEHIRSMMSWILTDLNHLDLSKKESIGESNDYIPEIRENNPTEKVRGSRINFKETIMMIEGSAVDEAFHRHLSPSGSIVHNDLTSQISESSEMLSAISVLSDQEIQLFPKEAHEEHQNMHAYPNSVAHEFSYQVIQGVSEATISASLLQDEADKPLEDGGTNDFNFVSIAFAHKELHTINDDYLEKLDNLEPVSLCATLQKHGSSLALAERPSLSTILPLENIKDENRLGFNGQGFFCQNKKTRKRKDLRKKDKNISGTDRAIDRLPSSDPKENNSNSEKPINRLASSGPEEKDHSDKPNPSWQLRVYNQLLREGRLNHCIELLEDLEGKGSLDMDKVYHVRFFEVCRRQKAVKEAFTFTRLIPKPTLSTFNMLMHVCTSSQDSEGAFQVLQNVEEAGLRADCKLYTTLISTCGKSGKVDTMFKVFHEMVNAGVEPNLHTYGALIDGCAKAGQVAKAFGAYGILRSKNVKPDRVVFNALISACGQSGAVDRAFDVLAEMKAEAQPVEPDHVTIGALMKACASADQIDRAREVYNMIHKHDIRGTAELYTIAVNSCSHHGDWEFACRVYDDMMRKGVGPDEMFISALIDVAGHAGKVDAAFEILQEAMAKGMHVGTISYGSLMGACSNAGDWQKAVELYEDVKGLNMKPTVPMMNALITALCNADQLKEAMQILSEMKEIGLCPNTITYSILLVASEKKDELDAGLMLISEAKKDGVAPNLIMCRCLISMCLRRFEAACKIGDSVLSVVPEIVQLNSRWTSLALMVYRETLKAGVAPTVEELSQVLGCLQLPLDASVRSRLVENLGVNMNTSKGRNPFSLIDGFGEYDPRAFSLVEEASSLGVIPLVSFKENPIIVDARNLQVHTAQVYLLTVLKGLKHRLAAGAKLPNVSVMLPTEKAQIQTSAGVKTINIASRVSQAVAALLRRLGISYIGNGSYGRIRINGVTIRKWFQPNLDSPFSKISPDLRSSFRHLGSGISRQRRKIRTGHLSLD